MSATSLHRERGTTNAAFFDKELLQGHHQMLQSASIANSEFYAAVRDADTGDVFALVVLFHWTRDYYNFTYKAMTDDDGPYVYRCPDRILDLLTPAGKRTLNNGSSAQSASEWYEKCRAYNQRRARARAVNPGQTIEFPEPIEFANGDSHKRLTLVSRNTFSDPHNPHRRYRVTNWRNQPFELTERPHP